MAAAAANPVGGGGRGVGVRRPEQRSERSTVPVAWKKKALRMVIRGFRPRAQLHWDISADRGRPQWDDPAFRSRSGHEEPRSPAARAFSEAARAVAAAKRPKPPKPTEADLQARLDAARMRVHEIVVLRMKTWLPAETLSGLREAETWRRGEVRLHHQMLKRLREEQR
jgi:hypothetical protein